MTDFSHITRALDVSERTAEFEFHMIEPSPIVVVRPATQSNPSYFSKAMKLGGNIAKMTRKGKGITREVMDELLARDYDLYPQHVIVSWKIPPTDASGNAVDMNRENTELFLRALPKYIFEEFRSFCNNEYNFLPEDESSIEDHVGN